jgi:inorganic pyrophosphatase
MQRPDLMNLSPHDPKTGLVRVVIDTPRGSRNKYKFGVFKLSRILPAGMSLIGAIETSVNKPVVRDIHDLSKDVLDDVEHFFCAYNEAQGRTFAISGRAGAKAAESVLRRALRSSARKTRNR